MEDGTTVVVGTPVGPRSPDADGTDADPPPSNPSVTDWMQGTGTVVAGAGVLASGSLWLFEKARKRTRNRRRARS